MIAAAILAGTLLSFPPSADAPKLNDKLVHAIAFALLVCPRTYRRPERWWRYAGLAFLLGAGIELVQPYVGRAGEWGDLLADSAGIICGIVIALAARSFRDWMRPRKDT